MFGDDGEEKGREGGKRPESNFLSHSLLLLAERDQANFLAEAAWDELGKQERRRMETFFPSSLLSQSLCLCFYLLRRAFGSIPNQGEEDRSNLTGVGSKEETGHEEEGLRALMGGGENRDSAEERSFLSLLLFPCVPVNTLKQKKVKTQPCWLCFPEIAGRNVMSNSIDTLYV